LDHHEGVLNSIETYFESFVQNIAELKVTQSAKAQAGQLLEMMISIPEMI